MLLAFYLSLYRTPAAGCDAIIKLETRRRRFTPGNRSIYRVPVLIRRRAAVLGRAACMYVFADLIGAEAAHGPLT